MTMTNRSDPQARDSMSPLGRLLRTMRGEQRGGTLLEVLIAVTIFSLVGVATLTGFATTQRAGARTDFQAQTENIGRNQMEYVFSQAYQAPGNSYLVIATPTHYSVTADAQEVVVGVTSIEVVEVNVYAHGQLAWSLETLRSED